MSPLESESAVPVARPPRSDLSRRTAFLVLDTETIPDGDLIARVKYPGENLDPEAAIARAQAEARGQSNTGSDFLGVSFQIPVAVCVARVADDFSLQNICCLDMPHYRPEEIARTFWEGVEKLDRFRLVTFNGRGFDMPMLELAAFRHGIPMPKYWQGSRNRFQGNHLDLMDQLTNFGASRMLGGLNLLAKVLNLPGKREVQGAQVYELMRAGRLREINDYCLCDTLDTYFVFLRSRVMQGEIDLDEEHKLREKAVDFLETKTGDHESLAGYLDELCQGLGISRR